MLDAADEAAALAAAWDHHARHNDPPGMVVDYAIDHEADDGEDDGDGEVHAVLLFHVIVIAPALTAWWSEFPDTDEGEQLGEANARAAAWAWYKRRHALAELLDRLLWCERCGGREPYSYAVDATTWSQPWCTECDREMVGVSDPWPECLDWSDDTAAEVECWAKSGGVHLPEVLT